RGDRGFLHRGRPERADAPRSRRGDPQAPLLHLHPRWPPADRPEPRPGRPLFPRRRIAGAPAGDPRSCRRQRPALARRLAQIPRPPGGRSTPVPARGVPVMKALRVPLAVALLLVVLLVGMPTPAGATVPVYDYINWILSLIQRYQQISNQAEQ